MIAILVCTHGNTAQEMIQSAEMICGEQQNIIGINYQIGESPVELRDIIRQSIDKLDVAEGLLCLSDIKGGTPFNVLMQLVPGYLKINVVTGVNIPMILQILLDRNLDVSLTNIVENAKLTAVKSIESFNELIDDGDDEF